MVRPDKWSRTFAIVVAAACVALPALADDLSKGVALPGLHAVPPEAVSLSATSVSLHADRVDLTLTLAVKPMPTNPVQLAIDFPRFGWLGESEPYPDRQFPELRIAVDGTPAEPKDGFAAFRGATNISEDIRAAGLDPFAIADTPPFVAPAHGADAAWDKLRRLDAVEKADDAYLAKWTVQRLLRIAIPPGANQVLALSYMARPAYALLRFDQIATQARTSKYCVTTGEFARLLDHPVPSCLFAVFEDTVPTGIDDRPPPKLTVSIGESPRKIGKRVLFAFCGADGKPAAGRSEDITGVTAHAGATGDLHILMIGTLPR